MRYLNFFFYLLFLVSSLSYTLLLGAEIKGTVLDASTQKPVTGVNIFILPQRIVAATTDENGKFVISEISEGAYQLMASYIGYNPQVKDVEIGQESGAIVDFEIILSRLDFATPVVTASKYEQALSDAPAAVSVIFPEDIAEADHATTLAEVLKSVTGLHYTKVSEGHYNITARGFNSTVNSTMQLLIDGRKLNSVFSNHINWAGISISADEIDRIEVVKGPGSALYGANAYSGVINIVTKSPREMKGTTIQTRAGGRGTFSASYTHAGTREKLAYKVSAGYFESDDFTELAPSDTSVRPEVKEPEAKVRLLKGDMRLEYQAATDTRFTFSGGLGEQQDVIFLAQGRSNVDRARDFYVSGKLQRRNLSILSYYNGSRTDTVKSLAGRRDIFLNNDLFNIEIQQSLGIGRKKLILGSSYQWQQFDSKGTVIPNVKSQNLFGLYAQFEAKLCQRVNLILAGRVDHHPTTKFQISPKAALIYSPSSQHSFRFTVNRAYINPVFVELYFFPFPGATFGARGNPDLNPRKITAFEVGYRGFIQKKLRVNLDVYHYILKDFIADFVSVDLRDPDAVSVVNFGKINENGVDFELLYIIGPRFHWSFNLSTFTADKKEPLPNAPKFTFNSSFYYENQHGLYGKVAVRFVDAFDWVSGRRADRIDSYATTDIIVGYRVPTDAIRVSVTASNLFNEKYRDLAGGAILYRRILGSLKTHF